MRVIPIRSGLIGGREGIQERISGGDWALVNAYRTIRPRTPLLKQTVPMLHDMSTKTSSYQRGVFSNCDTHDTRTPQHGRIRQLIDNVDVERVPLYSNRSVRPPSCDNNKQALTRLVSCDHRPRK